MQLTQSSLGIGTAVAASIASAAIDCAQMNKLSFQLNQTSAAVSFAATIQMSNDGINWVDTTTTAAITASSNIMLTLVDAPCRFYRLNLVRTSGTLTAVSAIFNGKF